MRRKGCIALGALGCFEEVLCGCFGVAVGCFGVAVGCFGVTSTRRSPKEPVVQKAALQGFTHTTQALVAATNLCLYMQILAASDLKAGREIFNTYGESPHLGPLTLARLQRLSQKTIFDFVNRPPLMPIR